MTEQKIETRTIRSRSFDPWHNLALEEALLGDVAPNEVILYLWQNENTVVIGRNQNAWQECRWKELEADNGRLARRLSGGGAVYHDLGNLNFTFVMDRALFDLHRQLEVILKAVRKLGVDAKFSGRNDLVAADGRKFSGNAFHHTSDAAYHHGTIMLNVDFDKLGKYLQVSQDKMKSKGVTSVKARVVNLQELSNEVRLDPLIHALRDSFIEVYGGDGEELLPSDITTDLAPLYDKYSSWEWRYGRTPKFDVSYSNRFIWGGIDMGFSLEDGRVSACTIYSDAMDSALIQEVSARLEQIPFRMEAILGKLGEVRTNENGKVVLNDLGDWLKTLSI